MNIDNVIPPFQIYLKVWWIPIVSYLLPCLIYLTATFVKSDTLIDVFIVVFYINLIGNILSAIYQLITKKWYFIIPLILASGLLCLYFTLMFMISPPDYYGAHKIIPDDIEISEPFNTPPPNKPPLDIEPSKADLVPSHLAINMGSQPGMYYYYTDYHPTELGNIYIKAYEVTTNDRLSAESIKHQSLVAVEDLEPKVYSEKFTIYEGSWGDQYGARIELWFEPLYGGEDYKVAERNYVVEGWMR